MITKHYQPAESVLWLAKTLLSCPKNSKLFLNTVDGKGEIPRILNRLGLTVSCTVESEDTDFYKEETAKKFSWDHNEKIGVSACPDLAMFDLQKDFQYALTFPMAVHTFDVYDGTEVSDLSTGNNIPVPELGSCIYEPVMASDVLMQYEVSQGSPDRMAPLHLMLLEQGKKAILEAGYHIWIVPTKWAGRYMKFVRSWTNEMGLVVRIELPEESIHCVDDATQYCPVPHVLIIWHKTHNGAASKSNQLNFATLSSTCFSAKLKNLKNESLEGLCQRFRKTEWWRYTVRKFHDFLTQHSSGLYSPEPSPPTIRSPKEDRIIKVLPEKMIGLSVFDSIQRIAAIPNAVRIIPLESMTKLRTYNPAATCSLEYLNTKFGYSTEERRNATKDNVMANSHFEILINAPLADCQHKLNKILCDGGMIPGIWVNDYKRFKKAERRLEIELTPMERVIRVPADDNSEKLDYWERIYDDVSVRASFPEVFNLWEKRAKQMKLDKPTGQETDITYPFQFEDIVFSACKPRMINGNRMGLGKTREILLECLLRSQKHTLIIVPVRLLGVWQDEIERTIADYVRVQMRDWSGQRMKSDYQVIKYARDCLPENLATFNLISYDSLSRVPKDSVFFECPKCSFRICSHFARYRESSAQQACPKCNHGIRKSDKKQNLENGFRKQRLQGGVVDDPRVSTGKVMMVAQEEQFPKVITKYHHSLEWENGKSTIVTNETKEIKSLHLKWTFAGILRNLFSMRVCDESNNIKNPEANRTIASNHCRARTRRSMTGTPISGYPESILSLINWTHRRSAFPEYRPEHGKSGPATRRFIKKYVTFVKREGKGDKKTPKISQPELFRQNVAPYMIRRLPHEPDVAKSIPPKTPVINVHKIEMDEDHKKFYNKWLEKFAEWWQMKRIEIDKKEASLVNDLLVKLGYLINASSIPHCMFDGLGSGDGMMWEQMIGKYTSPRLPAKILKCQELILENKKAGDKTIVFCWRKSNVNIGYSWCLDWTKKHPRNPIYSLRVTGDVSNAIDEKTNRSKKHEIISKFSNQDYDVLWSTTQTLKEGYNIPEANRGIFTDYTWVPSDFQQAMGRMLRPQQKKTVYGDFLCHAGTVDEYVAALVLLKEKSADEGIDYENFSDFKVDLIPDFIQYANSIVDGTNDELRTKMWLQVEELKKSLEDQEDEDEDE